MEALKEEARNVKYDSKILKASREDKNKTAMLVSTGIIQHCPGGF